jgi:ubiquinone/menaquinone biosynthesis C-methylase UbiE
MDHDDHVALLKGGVRSPGDTATWADIGAGEGAFTLALADLIGPEGRIVAVDRDAGALRANAEVVTARFPAVELTTLVADFTAPLVLPPIDGLVAANSLHFVPRDRQVAVIRSLAAHLRPGAPFIVVEYDADRGNPWVPHPFTATTFARLAAEAGLVDTTPLARVPSRFLGGIYSAVSRRPSATTSRSMSSDSL